jgi:hypothetical protein
MAPTSHPIDDFISDLPDFSKAICLKLDELIHQAEPELEEGKKWGSNSYWTKNSLVCGFYPTKTFVTFTFYEGASMQDTHKLFNAGTTNAKNRSIKFSSLDEVDTHAQDIVLYVCEAVANSHQQLNTKPTTQTIETPNDFKEALEKAELFTHFEAMAYSMRKEYITWIEDAKKFDTKQRRIAKALAQIAKGLPLYEQYKR